jgi:hypothetical protein
MRCRAPAAVSHALENRAAHQDRLERSLIGEPPVREVDNAEFGDRVVRVADPNPAGEALGQVSENEDEGESVGLIAGDTDEPGGGEIRELRVIAKVGGERLVEEELPEQVGRAGVGQPGELIAPFPAADQLGEPVL